MEQPRAWPDPTDAPPACGVGQVLWAAESDIAHFPFKQAADPHLTRTAIQRLHPVLSQSRAVRLLLGPAWATLRRDRDGDIALPVRVVSVAPQAHTTGRPRPAATPGNVHHVMITPNAGTAPGPDRTDTPGSAPRPDPDTTGVALQGARRTA